MFVYYVLCTKPKNNADHILTLVTSRRCQRDGVHRRAGALESGAPFPPVSVPEYSVRKGALYKSSPVRAIRVLFVSS